jgi:hypothetical protein
MAILTRARIRQIFDDLESHGVTAVIPRTCCRKCARYELPSRLRRKRISWVLLPAFDGTINPPTFDRSGTAKHDLILSFSGDEKHLTSLLRANGLRTVKGDWGDQRIIIIRRRFRAIKSVATNRKIRGVSRLKKR